VSTYQATLSKTATFVFESEALDPAGLESLANADPEGFWELAEKGKTVFSSVEVQGVGDADMHCHVCLAPLKVEMTAKFHWRLDQSMLYTDPRDVQIHCSEDPEHAISSMQTDRIMAQVLHNVAELSDPVVSEPPA